VLERCWESAEKVLGRCWEGAGQVQEGAGKVLGRW
jgi:hypothetical protein